MSIFDRGNRGNVLTPFESVAGSTDVGSILYSNPRITPEFNGTLEGALNYILDAIYPNYKGTVPNVASLPVSASVNDFYVVEDDGDGKSAGYVWTSIAGVDAWVKRYDVDWSYEQILADTVNRTSYMYAAKYGITDRDASGVAITGTFAGQRIFGGDQTSQNLTFTANARDATGFVQTTNTFRPASDNALDLGTTANKWRTGYFGTSVAVSTLTLSTGSITDSTGTISFGTNVLTGISQVSATTFQAGTLTLASGSITDSSGAITFGSANLTTTGTLTAATGSKLADITFTNGTFNTTSSVFSFSNKSVQGIDALTSSTLSTGEAYITALVLTGQTLKTYADGTALYLQAGNGGNTTTVQVRSKAMLLYDASIGGTLTVSGVGNHSFAGTLKVGTNLKLSSATTARIESLSGDLELYPASKTVKIDGDLIPVVAGNDLGTTALQFGSLYLNGSVSDGTNFTSIGTLLSLRAINSGVTNGMSLFYDSATGTWKPALPNSGITHSTLSGLTTGDAGHTQFAMLNGRVGGQTIYGGTAASESLTLDSTTDATKGFVLVSSTIAPSTDATYSAGWQGTDVGGSSRYFRDVYAKGIFYGLRFDQYAGSGTYPANSGQSVGRVIWDTSLNQLLVDTGSTWAKVGQQKYINDTTWDGVMTNLSIVVSGSISDARTALWQLRDNTNSFEIVHAKITTTQTAVTIIVNPALPSGSYRLIGLN